MFFASDEGVLALGSKSYSDVATRTNKKFDNIFSCNMWIQYTKVTERQTDTGRQQRPCLHIASRSI